MNKHLSIVLTTGACAGLIAAAGFSQTRAQSNMEHKQDQMDMESGKMKSDTEKTAVERDTGMPAGNMRTVTITVKDVDRAANMVTFQAKVSPEANIKKNGMPIKLNELEAGDSLKVAFDPRTGEVMRAEVIRKKAPQ
jgi:hypothetical protein